MALNRNQRRAVKALMAAPSVAAAARMCGLSERTLWRYLAEEEFKAALRDRQDREGKALAAALSGLSGAAVETLHELMTDPLVSASVRARVADAWLKRRREVIELDELADRLAILEEKLEVLHL